MSIHHMTAPPAGSSYQEYLFEELIPEGAYTEAYFVTGTGPKDRIIYQPSPMMAIVQKRFLEVLNGLNYPMPYAHNVRGRSIASNVATHRNSRYFFLMDIHRAYPSLSLYEMAHVLTMIMAFASKELLHKLGDYDDALGRCREWLADWCFLPHGGVITGASSAPMLFNLYAAARFDEHLSDWLVEEGITYTRYMDDLTFSAQAPITKVQRRLIREKLDQAGFLESHRKTQVNLDITKGPIEINGVMLDAKGRVFPSKRFRNRATGMMAAALSGDISPAQAHGYAGACYQALPGLRDDRLTNPTVQRVRQSQEKLLGKRPTS